MKIYCIKVDCAPFCSEVFQMRDKIGGHLVRQIGGCYTAETILQMLAGKHSSKLIPNGIGYHKHLTTPSWPYAMEDTVPYILHKRGFRFRVLNPSSLKNTLKYGHYDWYEETKSGDDNFEFCRGYIQNLQTTKDDSLCMVGHEHFHRACESSNSAEMLNKKQRQAANDTLNLLNCWNFNEPDSLFWVFSDHGHHRLPELGGYPWAHNFVTWAIIKDNRIGAKPPTTKFIAATDFHSYILTKDWPIHETYFTEDGRIAINAQDHTTAIACKFIDNIFICTIYHKPDKKFIQRNYSYLNYKLIPISNALIDENLIEKLKSDFDWIK